MPSLTPLSATSELAAVNRLLAAVGEAPISDLTTSTREDVALAVTFLKEASLEVQSLGWRFNREFGLELAPSDTLVWTGTDGRTETLNIFRPPANLLGYRITKSPKQACLDLVLRPSRTYETGSPPAKVVVFYDREKNRDGLVAETYPYLYIDPLWWFEWEFLPEVARRYITVKAARVFIQKTLGDATVVGYEEQDELRALFALEREEGEEEDVSMLDNSEVARVRGLRPGGFSGFSDYRASPGPVSSPGGEPG